MNLEQENITKKIKILSIAHQVALEYDACQGTDKLQEVYELLFDDDVNIDDVEVALQENEGSSPDDINLDIHRLIKLLK